jgi:hypothetical protein
LAPTVEVTPAAPLHTEELVCSVTDPAVDPDGDPIMGYSFEFLVDGLPSGYGLSGGDEFDTLTVPASATTGAEVWTCEVWADDGVAAGPGHIGEDEVAVIALLNTVSLEPVADSYVSSSSTSSNYGTASELLVDRSYQQSYLKFDLSSLPLGATIDEARLTLTAYTGFAHGGNGNVYTYLVSDDSWTEMGITYSNAPSYDPTALGSWFLWYNYNDYTVYEGTFSTDDLRIAVEDENDTDQFISLRLACSGYRTNYRTRDYSVDSERPQLEVTYVVP